MYVPNEAVQTRNWYLIKQKMNFGCCGVWIVSKPNLCLQSPTSKNMWNTYGFSKFEPNNNLAVVCMVETLEPQEKFPRFQVPNFEAFGVVIASHPKKTKRMYALTKPLPRSVKKSIFHRVSKYFAGFSYDQSAWNILNVIDFSTPYEWFFRVWHYTGDVCGHNQSLYSTIKKSNHMCDWLFKHNVGVFFGCVLPRVRENLHTPCLEHSNSVAITNLPKPSKLASRKDSQHRH